ncbi:hypothetical protein C0991_006973 [Blastosporella zonata]|nr:hypothetical protein C0991_006973 [Blastosporella zonata]
MTQKISDGAVLWHQLQLALKPIALIMSQPHSSTPPGLVGNLNHVLSGGDALEWLAFEKRKDYTNAFIIQRDKEEAGITAPLEHAGTLLFTSGIEDVANHIEIYRADEYSGVISETDEMRPEWFSLPSSDSKDSGVTGAPPIPFEQMWDTDVYWMPLLISKTKFAGRVDFRRDGDVYTLHKWWYGTPVEN